MTNEQPVTNVIGIRGSKHVIQAAKPDQNIVNQLEEILKRVKDGEIVGLSCVYLMKNETANWAKSGFISYRMVGGIEALKLKILNELAE